MKPHVFTCDACKYEVELQRYSALCGRKMVRISIGSEKTSKLGCCDDSSVFDADDPSLESTISTWLESIASKLEKNGFDKNCIPGLAKKMAKEAKEVAAAKT